MKVCTDACLLGAWAAQKINTKNLHPNNILDIGTGTGLLALMLAQKTTAQIDAVEIDAAAAIQAAENCKQSPWSERLHVFNSSILEFHPLKKYDCIISNPPFFQDDLLSNDAAKNVAKHHSSLDFSGLLQSSLHLLHPNGFIILLIPYHRTAYLQKISGENGLCTNEMLFVKQSPSHTFFRTIILLSKKQQEIKKEELIIHNQYRQYSAAFTALLQDYYLML